MMVITRIIIVMLMWVCVVVLHELGHYIGYRMFKRDVNLTWEGINPVFTDKFTFIDSYRQKLTIYAFGVVLGFIPLAMYLVLINPSLIEGLVHIGAYAIGSQYDIEQSINIIRREK